MIHLDGAWQKLVDAGGQITKALNAGELDGPESEELIAAVKRIRYRISRLKEKRGQVPLERAKPLKRSASTAVWIAK